MGVIYEFYKLIFIKLSFIKLKGQNTEDNLFFSAVIWSLFPMFNILSIAFILEKYTIIELSIVNEYPFYILIGVLLLIAHLLFLRKEKSNNIKNKKDKMNESQTKRMNFVFYSYFAVTVALFFLAVLIH